MISKVILLSQEPVHILFTALTSIRVLEAQKIQNIAVFIATLMPMTCVISIFCIMIIVILVISIRKVQLEPLQELMSCIYSKVSIRQFFFTIYEINSQVHTATSDEAKLDVASNEIEMAWLY